MGGIDHDAGRHSVKISKTPKTVHLPSESAGLSTHVNCSPFSVDKRGDCPPLPAMGLYYFCIMPPEIEKLGRDELLEVVREQYDKIENLRSRLLADHSLLQVRDFGAGFGGKIYKERSVHYITKHSSKPAKYARLLSRLISYTNSENLLEIGTS